MSNRIDRTGQKFGRLTVIRPDGVYTKPCGTTESKFWCKCDCGNELSVLSHNLVSGNTSSCGCLAKEIGLSKLLPNNKGVINHIILQYKRHARERNLEWRLTYEEVEKIISMPCHYCGTVNSNCHITKNCKKGFKHNGIDRIDNTKGYIPDNIVPCCCICNRAKNNMEKDEFIAWVFKTADYLTGKSEKQLSLFEEE
ncbi:MAG: hypothetical protein J6A30_09515 [Ruminococcus sp.]|nr:hypothetical protein [Ruminococcus sp.]